MNRFLYEWLVVPNTPGYKWYNSWSNWWNPKNREQVIITNDKEFNSVLGTMSWYQFEKDGRQYWGTSTEEAQHMRAMAKGVCEYKCTHHKGAQDQCIQRGLDFMNDQKPRYIWPAVETPDDVFTFSGQKPLQPPQDQDLISAFQPYRPNIALLRR